MRVFIHNSVIATAAPARFYNISYYVKGIADSVLIMNQFLQMALLAVLQIFVNHNAYYVSTSFRASPKYYSTIQKK